MKHFTSKTQKIGEIGENAACMFLMKQGFSIIERNYTKKWGEIDIVARKGNMIHFIEVKAVSRKLSVTHVTNDPKIGDYWRPEDQMHPWKRKRMARTVQTYILERRVRQDFQCDLLVVYIDKVQRKARVKPVFNILL